jgi:hypothetical protein
MKKLSERRLKENEIIFREANRNIADYVEEQVGADGLLVSFYCECARLNCRQRLQLTISMYKNLHSNNRQFIALEGHEIPEIEKVILKGDGYVVIEKTGEMPSQESVDIALRQTSTSVTLPE